jgi:hypothetical protein
MTPDERPIDFDRVVLLMLQNPPPELVLVVEGVKPFAETQVILRPATYVRQPEYWQIDVVGRTDAPGPVDATAPYVEGLNLTGLVGTCGIQVAGATRSERCDVRGGPAVAT